MSIGRLGPFPIWRYVAAVAVCSWIQVAAAIETSVAPSVGRPSVTASSAILVDAETGTVLYAKDADVPRFPASTTKILTALLLVENAGLDDMVVAPHDVEKVTDASLHLRPGERVSVRELLYAIMLRSANDACYAAAVHVAGSGESFASLMNRRAKEIGCQGTNFVNPHGLHDRNHKTTAHDLALIACEAMRRPEIEEVVRTRKHQIARSTNQQDLWLTSRNRLLGQDPTVDGIKTGFTVPAGRCFVGSATRNGYRLISVVLKSDDWCADTTRLFDWGFGSLQRVRVAQKGDFLGTHEIADSKADRVRFGPDKDVCAFLPIKQEPSITYQFSWAKIANARVLRGTQIGTATIRHDGEAVGSFAVVALEDATPKGLIAKAGQASKSVALVALAMIGATYWLKRKARLY